MPLDKHMALTAVRASAYDEALDKLGVYEDHDFEEWEDEEDDVVVGGES